MRRATLVVAVLAASLIGASTAHATFHLMKISEVGNTNNADYVELQMYVAGQNLVGGHFIRTYNATGQELSTFEFPANVANGQSQRTILVARDEAPLPGGADFTTPNLAISATGAVCFLASISPVSGIDCVSFGAFPGVTGGAPSPMGSPAPELVAGTSIHRSIAPGCATLLEAGDDTNDSAADFAVAPGSPRRNTVAPTEQACAQPDTKAPETTITQKPQRKVTKRKVTIGFESSESGSAFECKLDKGSYKPCDSPFKKGVGIGRHTFQVAATDRAGNADASPAKVKFRRVRKK